jgi:hypothetical protein
VPFVAHESHEWRCYRIHEKNNSVSSGTAPKNGFETDGVECFDKGECLIDNPMRFFCRCNARWRSFSLGFDCTNEIAEFRVAERSDVTDAMSSLRRAM